MSLHFLLLVYDNAHSYFFGFGRNRLETDHGWIPGHGCSCSFQVCSGSHQLLLGANPHPSHCRSGLPDCGVFSPAPLGHSKISRTPIRLWPLCDGLDSIPQATPGALAWQRWSCTDCCLTKAGNEKEIICHPLTALGYYLLKL